MFSVEEMEKNKTLSLTADILAESDLNHDVLYFEPFRSHTIKEASQFLISECKKDTYKRDVFKYNMTELFKKQYESLAKSHIQKVKPNTALLERVTLEIFNHTEKTSLSKLKTMFPDLRITDEYERRQVSWTEKDNEELTNIPFVKRWYKEYPHMIEKELVEMVQSRCYVVLHIASYVLEEHELKKIYKNVASQGSEKTIRHTFLEYELMILRLLKFSTCSTSQQQSNILQEYRFSLKFLINSYNSMTVLNGNRQAAELNIQCFWIILSKMAVDGKISNWAEFEILESLQSISILCCMIEFWTKYPINSVTLQDRKFLHEVIMQFIILSKTEMDYDLVNNLIVQQKIAQNGVISKTFAFYHASRYSTCNVALTILKFTDSNTFPPISLSEDPANIMETEEKEPLMSTEQFEFMWDNIVACSLKQQRKLKERIIIRSVIAGVESQIKTKLKRMAYLSKEYLIESPSYSYYKKLADIVQKKSINSIPMEIENEGYKLIANLQSETFTHFVNLSPIEAEMCFERLLDMLINIPVFMNSRTPYEIITLCFQNACLQRNNDVRNFMAEKIVFLLETLNNYHALNHFLLMLAKVLRSHSSEDLMRKTYNKKDVLIVGIEKLLRDIEQKIREFDSNQIDILDSHFQVDANCLDNLLDHYCQVHFTCLSIITFCDQTHSFPPLSTWFGALDRILEMSDSANSYHFLYARDVYIQILCKQFLNTSTSFPYPPGELLQSLRDRIPIFLMLNRKSISENLVDTFIQLPLPTFIHRNIDNICCNESILSFYLIQSLNENMKPGTMIPAFVNSIIKNAKNNSTQKNHLALILRALQLSWTHPVQHEDMEYLTTVSGSTKLFINIYFQFKLRNEVDGSEFVVITIGNLVVKMKYSCDSSVLRCLVTTNNGDKFLILQHLAFKVHNVMLQISSDGDEIYIVTPSKVYQMNNRRNTRPIDELKISINSLHHTIPIIFQGDRQSLFDVHQMGITSKHLEQFRRLTLATKGRKLNIGQIFHSVMPIRHNQTIALRYDQRGFENLFEQLKAAGGFGFVFHNFSKLLINSKSSDDTLPHWQLLLKYLNTPYLSSEKFSKTEALQMTSLLFRHTKCKIPEVIIQNIFDKCMIANHEIREAVLLNEILSEPSYWENDLTMFYWLLIRFKSSIPGSNLEKCLPLILQIVARIIRSDQGTDVVHDIVTVTVEIFKDWCREPHAVRTTQLVTFMLDLFDFEKINNQSQKFQWLDENVIEKEMSRQPLLSINGDDSGEDEVTRRRINRELLQLDLPLGNVDDDELFHVLTPTEIPTDADLRHMARNKDYMMKGLLQIIHQSYVLCPDTKYAYFDSITAEKICYLIEVNHNGKVVGALIEMYEAIINHNIYSDKITKIVQLNLLPILARQLRNKPLTMQSVNALFSILLREQVDVSAGLDNAHLETFSPNTISCHAVYPLLTIFEESADDVEIAVFTVVCTSLNKAYTFNNQLTQAMTAAGIDEHMVAILEKLSKLGDFRIRNEKLKALLDPWFAFAISIIRIGVNGRYSVFEGASRFISHLLLFYTQENGKLLDHPENESQRLIRDNVYWALCVLVLQLFKFLLDLALADSNKHRSASNSSLHMMGYDEEPEEIDATPTKPTKFWDDIAQKVKESVLGPNHNLLKCPYRKHKESPLTAEEMRHRIKDVLTLCQYFFKITNRIDCDEEDSLYRIFFEELSKWTLDECWPNCIWVAADMMFVTNVFANCVAFVLSDIHQYITPFNKVFVRQKNSRVEILLHKLIRSNKKISTVFRNIMDIDQMIRLAMENITQREDHNSNLFKLAVHFLNSPTRMRNYEFPQPGTPDQIQKMTVESEIASRYWLDQRNEVIGKINLKGRIPELYCDVSEINQSLERMQKTLAIPRNMKRINEICELMGKIQENEQVFSRLTMLKNNYVPSKITTVLGPRGERMVTDLTDLKSVDMFNHTENFTKIGIFPDVFEALSLSWIRKPNLFAQLRNACLHGVLITNGIQTNPIFHVHKSGINALPHGSHIVEKTFLFEDMTMIFRRPMRPWDALEVSFEIMMNTHDTILIFAQQRFAKLVNQYAGKLIATETHLLAFTRKWEEGKMSNFEYLTMLNLFSGRTIHDSSTYPIFPRILAKFGDSTIDLQDKTIYRKLDRPVAAQDLLSVEKHKEHYNELKDNEAISHLSPYHFGSMCSNRGVVSFYNIRLLPFGEEAIELQDGRFDFPDRLFHNIESGLGLGKIESSNDYKELVPELFTTAEVLRNENRNIFGEKQNGETVNDVDVPQWCYVKGEAVHDNFIHLHRHALESEYVQSMLHHWIDLIFGYKSRGKAAHDSINVYHPAVYPGNSPPLGFDRVMTIAYEANQKTLGTAPIQLFTQPHPKREVVQHRHGSVRNMNGLAFGKELTVGQYEVGEYTMDRQTTQRVWRKMKSLKSRIFSKANLAEQEAFQLFKKSRDRRDKDVTEFTYKTKDNILIVSDGLVETSKEHNKSIEEMSVDENYVACLVEHGPVEIYQIVQKRPGKSKNAFEKVSFLIDYYGTLPIQEDHYTCVEICASFSSIFTLHRSEKKSVVSVWSLHTQHIRASCVIEGLMESCGLLKNLGELIVVEKWNGEQVKHEKIWRNREKESKKKKYVGKIEMERTEQIIAKISINAKPFVTHYVGHYVHSGVISMAPEPGMGIQTLALIRQDHCIVLFETLNLTEMRVLEVENRLDYCLRELRYQEDNSLIAVFKENRSLRKKNKELYKNLGCTPPTKTWRFKVKI
uniref:BEACH domain-containing protein n=1 Tax=Caenorhabditis tropicalis TaxID=1561998 RepID=A0A1I7TZ35_9PELO